MPIINVNFGQLVFSRGEFRPQGKKQYHGMFENYFFDGEPDTYASLLIVRLIDNRNGALTESDVIRVAEEWRGKQVGQLGASFITQTGMLKHRPNGTPIEEEAARIILLHLPHITGENREVFKGNIFSLGRALGQALNQDPIFIEFQDKGETERIWEIDRALVRSVSGHRRPTVSPQEQAEELSSSYERNPG